MEKQVKTNIDYDSIPVHYCSRCLTLRVMRVSGIEGLDYCDSCGSTQIESCNIEEWRSLYKQRYGFDYLDK